MLHVQEVGGERPLGGVGVVGALLALLLLLNRSSHVTSNGHHELSSSRLERAEQVTLALGGGLTKQKVGLADVVLGERPQELQNGGQAANSLLSGLALCIATAPS
jgi:hypothetical protein